MDENYLAFGKYIKQLRNERKLTTQQVADKLTMSKGNIGDIERGSRPPFKNGKMKAFIKFLKLTGEETVKLYDLAGKCDSNVSFDIRDIFNDEEVGELARIALRLSKEVDEPEAKWKRLIRELEAEKAEKIRDKTDGGEES